MPPPDQTGPVQTPPVGGYKAGGVVPPGAPFLTGPADYVVSNRLRGVATLQPCLYSEGRGIGREQIMEESDIPVFMQNLPTSTGLEDLKVGSKVLVKESRYHNQEVVTEAEVIKKGRVWVTVRQAGVGRFPREWRFRLHEGATRGSEYSSWVGFYTPDQYLVDTAFSRARKYLGDQGVRLDTSSPFREGMKIIQLARIVWAVQNPSRMVEQ